MLERARAGRLRIIGSGRNRVDMVHIENAVDAHLLAEQRLVDDAQLLGRRRIRNQAASGLTARAFFITNGEPVVLWEWINELLRAVGEPPVTKRISLGAASALGAACEVAWRVLPLRGEPPMTRFVAAELAKDHWFDITAARRDLGYVPRVTMEQGTAELIESLKGRCERGTLARYRALLNGRPYAEALITVGAVSRIDAVGCDCFRTTYRGVNRSYSSTRAVFG